MRLGILLGVICGAAPLTAAPNLIFDWSIRGSTTTTLNPDIEHIPHPGHDIADATHIYNRNVWLTADATDRVVGLMLQNDTGPYDGTRSYALGDSLTWMSANGVTLDYVFSDVETVTTHENVLVMVDLVRQHANPKINQSRLVQYDYYAGEVDESAQWPWITNRTDGVNEHQRYLTSGVDVANPACYPYEYFSVHAWSGEWGVYQCPDARSALFWAPLERCSTAKRNLPQGHQLIPWIAGFIPWDGYSAPPPGPEDRRALLQHMRLRGSDGYYRLVSWVPGLSEEDHRAEMLDAWHDLDAFFAPAGNLEILELGTDKTSGVNYSASRKKSRTRVLVSNLSGSSTSVVYPTTQELPDTSPEVSALTHDSFEYLVYRPMDEDFEAYGLNATMDLKGFQGPNPDRLEVFVPPGVSNTSQRALGPKAGVGAADAWWATDFPGLASNEVAVYSAKLYGAAGVGFAPLAVDGYVLANNGSTLPDTQRQGPYTSFAAGKVRSRLSYAQGDTYEATNYTVVDGRWYEVQVVLDTSGAGPAVTRTYIRDLSIDAVWTQLTFDNLATGGVEADTELPAVFSALANPATFNGWQVYGANDTCRIDDLWTSLYPWIEGGDHGPAELFYVATTTVPVLLDPAQMTVSAFDSFPPASFGVSNAFNGAGLSGDLHNDAGADMWRSTGSALAGKWVKVDLGGTYELDHLRVWNYNQAGATDTGLRQADIFVALSDPGNNVNDNATPFDATGWTMVVSDQLFAASPGGPAIANTDAMIDLGGVEAAYLALRVDDNHGAGAGEVGLSEVQVMVLGIPQPTYPLIVNGGTGDGSYAQGSVVPISATTPPSGWEFRRWAGDSSAVADDAAMATTVTMPHGVVSLTATYRMVGGGGSSELLDPAAFTVTSFSTYGGILSADAFNGQGLSGDTHNNSFFDMWFSNGYAMPGKWIKVNLGGTYNLDHLRVWNFNQNNAEYRGVKQADIYVALTDPGNNTDKNLTPFNNAGWTLAVEDYVFSVSPGGAAITNTDAHVDLGGVEAAFLAIRIDSGYVGGTQGDVGLSEVQIYLEVAGSDHDGDGLSSDWEIGVGLDPLDDGTVDPDQGADGDPDLDGATNREEWIADTHANDSNSVFVVAGTASNPDGSVDVNLDSSSARVYLLRGTAILSAPLPWPVLDGPNAGTGGAMSFNAAAAAGEQAYAVEVRLP